LWGLHTTQLDLTLIVRGRFSVAEGSAYCHEPSADDHPDVCAPILFAEVAALVMTTISEDAAQAMLDQTCAKIVDECEMMEMITIQVDSLVPCSTGGFALLGSTAHNRFEHADAVEVKFARNTMNASIRGHPMYRNIFKHLFNTAPKVSQKGMAILDVISMEVTLKERVKADQQLKAPIFAIKSTAKKIESTATYHEGFVWNCTFWNKRARIYMTKGTKCTFGGKKNMCPG